MKVNYLMPVARLMMGWIFIPSGLSKLFDPETTATYISDTAGLPFPEVVGPGTGVFETVLGACLIMGFRTRIAAGSLAHLCLATAVLFHGGKGAVPGLSADAIALLTELHFYMVFKNIAMAGGLLAVAVHGAGAFSVDQWQGGRKSRALTAA